MAPTEPAACSDLTVLYDGACPLCRREVGVYRELQPLDPQQALRFVDVSRDDAPLPAGGDRQAYLARFHVQRGDGQVLSGARAFIALWAALPGWRWLARAGALPGAATVMEWAYRGFLRVRPVLQRIAARLEPRPAASPGSPAEPGSPAPMAAPQAAAEGANRSTRIPQHGKDSERST
jgi:predicted DCC family thiol-disulfide oxidoreductase YuxK